MKTQTLLKRTYILVRSFVSSGLLATQLKRCATKRRFACLLLVAMMFAALNVAAQNSITYYVSDNDGDDANNGLSPNTAFESLQRAIAVMRQSTVNQVNILVEGGRYYPFDEDAPLDNIADSTFRLFRNETNQAGKSLKIRGGYDFQTGVRDIVNNPSELRGKTVFEEGRINHVITIGVVDPTADSLIIDGLEITSGAQAGYGSFEFVPGAFSSRASGGGITITGCNNNKIVIRNCDINVNEKAVGGGVAVTGSSGVNFQNCLFRYNGAYYDQSSPVNSGVGGAAYIAYSTVNFQGCVFYGNGSSENRNGSVMYISNSGGETVRLVNCTVTASRGLHPAFGSLYVESGNLRLINSIVWNNNGAQIIKSSSPTANANIFLSNTIHEWADQYGEDTKWTTAPGFRNETNPKGGDEEWFTTDDGLQIATCAATPALDGGNNSSWPFSVLPVDVTGRPRLVAGQIDLGAYEEQTATVFQLWPDADGDGYGPKGVDPLRLHCKLEGFVENGGDCDDNDNTVHPWAREICGDGKDNDCNGGVDDVLLVVNFPDGDDDGYGDPNGQARLFCGEEPGYSLNNLDCDDTNKDIHPAAAEICDGKDNNCDGVVDENFSKTNYYLDADGDGYGKTSDVIASCSPIANRATKDGDCDDTDNTVYPGATEICDGKDNDCNNIADDGVRFNYYLDADRDGYGKTSDVVASCSPIEGRVTQNGDCDDDDNTVYPGAPEICDSKDNNCNNQIDEDFSHQNRYYRDSDGDGFGYSQDFVLNCTPVFGRVTIDGDCDDNDANINPNTNWVLDKDSDGYYTGGVLTQCISPGAGYVIKTTQQAGDCDDQIATLNPSTKWYKDADSDGYSDGTILTQCAKPGNYKLASDLKATSGDCSDNNAAVNPGATEICGNGIDDNCNGKKDEAGCIVCGNGTNLTTANITSSGATLKWNALVDAVQWEVEYKKISNGTKWVTKALPGTARSVTISGLSANQTYNWHIRAKCNKTWTTFSNAVSFKTLATTSTLMARSSTVEALPLNAIEEKSSALKLYPNPNKGQFMVELHLSNNINANAKIELLNMMGQTVSTDNASINNGRLYKNVGVSSSLAAGMYIAKITVNNKTYLARVVYQK